MKDDEVMFLVDISNKCANYAHKNPLTQMKLHMTPRKLINEPNFYMNYKRAWYLLGKWSRKGWYNYGVSLDLGWLTPEGEDKAVSLQTVLVIEQWTKETDGEITSKII